MIMMLLNLVLAVVVMSLWMALNNMLFEGKKTIVKVAESTAVGTEGKKTIVKVAESIVVGTALGIFNYAIPKTPWGVSLVAMIFAISAMIYVAYLWLKEGSSLKEFVCYAVIVLLIYGVGNVAAQVVATQVTGWIAGVILWLPAAVMATVIVFAIGNAVSFYGKSSGNKSLAQVGKLVVAAGIIVAAIMVVYGGANVTRNATGAGEAMAAPAATTQIQTTEKTTTTTTVVPEADEALSFNAGVVEAAGLTAWQYRHDGVLDNETKKDDYDFSNDPLDTILTRRASNGELSVKDLANKSEKQLYGLLVGEDADDILEVIEDWYALDPAGIAGMAAWYDANMHTDILGEFFTDCKNESTTADWMTIIESAASAWADDPELFYAARDNFYAHLEHADEIIVQYVKSGINDQMYMDGLTIGERPKVIVMESANHDGYFVTFKYVIKETKTVEVSYRINCGFQPCNVAKVLGVKAKKNPNKPTPVPQAVGGGGGSSSGSSGGGGGGSGSGGGGGGGIKKKNPTDGIDTLPNDDPGPGPKTIDPSDPSHSTEDLPTNSNHESLDDYKDDMSELKDINDHQKEGGDSNTPSTSASSSDTKVDSNADSGTGNGGIDHPTETSSGATTSDSGNGGSTGSSSSVSDDKAGDEWEGPSL